MLYQRQLGAEGYMLYGQQYDQGHWYLFDKVTGAMQYSWQNLSAYGQNKIVYYNSVDGTMQYGTQWIGDSAYYFDRVTGAYDDPHA